MPDSDPKRPPCTCPPSEPWDPEWDGVTPIDSRCPYHGDTEHRVTS